MKQQEIQPVEHEITVYTVGDKEFFSKADAEEYIQNVEKYLNNTYYEVMYKDSIEDSEFSRCRIIGVPGVANGDEHHNIAWIPHILNRALLSDNINIYSHDENTAAGWRIVGQRTFSSFQEFSEFMTEWETRVNLMENYYSTDEILISGLRPERVSIRTIHDLAQSEKGV